MKLTKTLFDGLPGISKFDLQYLHNDPIFQKYQSFSSDLNGIKEAILEKKSNYKNRKSFIHAIKIQHKDIQHSAVIQSIRDLEQDNCYSVTSAHQPCLFGGPAFFIYKISSTINLASKLNTEFPEHKFVPIFYLGCEDHDFEEINHLNLFNNKIVWTKDAKGACGRLSNEGLEEVKNTILSLFENQPEKKALIEKLLTPPIEEHNYKLAMRSFIYSLFADFGLVVVDPDDTALKRLMISIFKDELLNQRSEKILDNTIKQLEKDKIKVQARGRDINLFYLINNVRERILHKDGKYTVLNTEYQFTREEMMNEVESFPERFSPNVIIRPLYQESILPNVAFIGGGGEVAYWTELRDIFNYYGVTYPPIFRRNSVTVIDKGLASKMKKIGMSTSDLSLSLEEIESNYLKSNSEVLDFIDFKNTINKEFDVVSEKVMRYDSNLIGKLNADKILFVEKINDWEKKLNKQIKLKHENGLNQLKNLYQRAFPNLGLQERYESSLYVLTTFGLEIIPFLVESLDPIDRNFIFIEQQ